MAGLDCEQPHILIIYNVTNVFDQSQPTQAQTQNPNTVKMFFVSVMISIMWYSKLLLHKIQWDH